MAMPPEFEQAERHCHAPDTPCSCADGDSFGPERIYATLELTEEPYWVLPHPWMNVDDALPRTEEDEQFIGAVIRDTYVEWGDDPHHAAERTSQIALHALWRHPRWGEPTRFTAAWLVLRDAQRVHLWPPKPGVTSIEIGDPSRTFFHEYNSTELLAHWLRTRFEIPS